MPIFSIIAYLAISQKSPAKTTQSLFGRPGKAGKEMGIFPEESEDHPYASVSMPTSTRYGKTKWLFTSPHDAYVSILLDQKDPVKAKSVLARLRSDLKGPDGPKIRQTGVDIGVGFAIMKAHVWETQSDRKGLDIVLIRPEAVYSAMVSWVDNKTAEAEAIDLARAFIWTTKPSIKK